MSDRPARRPEAQGPQVALLSKRGRVVVAEPFFRRGGRRVSLPPKARGGASVGRLVLVGGGKRGPRVVRELGRPDVARDVLEALMLDRGLRRTFAQRVDDEARVAAAEPPWGGERRDLTDLPTFTIDPTDARDYDDAISAERSGGDDAVRLWVHIADVSAHVRPGTALDGEAVRRGTSVYVPGAVEPMLPGALSTEACSLVPGLDRPAVTVELELALGDRGPEVRSASFYRSTIRSDTRLTYAQVDEIFAGRERAEDPWAAPLDAARAVSAALRERRSEIGASLEVEGAEPTFEFDDEGHVVGVIHEEQTESHRLIEELMILANEQVASLLEERRIPTLYRVHERPEPESVAHARRQARLARRAHAGAAGEDQPAAGRRVRGRGEPAGGRARASQRRRAARRRSPRSYSARRSRPPTRRRTSATPGSAARATATSPRRSGVTRTLSSTGRCSQRSARTTSPRVARSCPTSRSRPRPPSVARSRSSATPPTSAAPSCSSASYAQRGQEEPFEGEVVGVIGAGAFVRFGEEGFEGFLPVRKLRGDWWNLNEHETALVAEKSGRQIRLGDAVSVEVARVEAARGRVDLLPAP